MTALCQGWKAQINFNIFSSSLEEIYSLNHGGEVLNFERLQELPFLLRSVAPYPPPFNKLVVVLPFALKQLPAT